MQISFEPETYSNSSYCFVKEHNAKISF